MPTVSELRVTLKALDRKLRVSTMNKPTLIAKIAEYQAKALVKTNISSTTAPKIAPKTAPQTDKTKSPSINDTASVKNMKTALEVLESKRAKCDKNIVRISKLKKKIKKAGKASVVAPSVASAPAKKPKKTRFEIMADMDLSDAKSSGVYDWSDQTPPFKFIDHNGKKMLVGGRKLSGNRIDVFEANENGSMGQRLTRTNDWNDI